MLSKGKSPYIPSFIKASISDTRPTQLTFSDISETNIKSTSSFKYEPIDFPLKSTQQLNVDWSKFENHTFFSSAEVKVNTAFDQIINGFPFDGTKKEVEAFFEKMSGFEKWVFNQFPTFGGYLHFSGTQVGEDPSGGYQEELGTWIEVKDTSGWLYPDISKNILGESYLNPPANKSFTIEAHVFLPDQTNDTQVVLQKISSDKLQGYTFHIDPSAGNTATGTFSIISGSVRNSVSAVLSKGSFNHVCISLNRELGNNYLQFFVNELLQGESKKDKLIEEYNDRSDLLIGSGSSFYVNNSLVAPTQTFSGSIDELRIFHGYRTPTQQRLYASKGLYASNDLKLYYRFNEPPTLLSSVVSDPVNSIVLDSSGNSLHSLINNFTASLRMSSVDNALNPMTNEKLDFKVILFPYNPSVISLNSNLLTSASLYDQANPNLISKLIPRHYLREGAFNDGYGNTSVEGSLGSSYSGEGIPGEGQLGSAQVILTFLYIWSKFFDEMKMFIDSFKTLRTVDYALPDTTPDNFLNDFIRSYGFYLPPMFNNSNISQYVEGENINDIGIGNYALKHIQTQILRRVLVNMPDILRSKGTQHSIKSFLRSIGIDPDNSMRIREFGGPAINQFGSSREFRTDPIPVVNFTSSSIAYTPFLSSSRYEVGYPEPVGPLTSLGLSTNTSDGLLTSGSWTYEGCYRYAPTNKSKVTSHQSLMRLEVTGSASTAQPGIILNLVSSGSLMAFLRPGMGTSSPVLKLEIPEVDILNGDRWSISVGCNRNDSIFSTVSSSYFLRAATQTAGNITSFYTTSSFFKEEYSSEGNAFRILNSTNNASGSRIAIGNNLSIPEGSIGYLFLNNTLDSEDAARANQFVGQVSNIRFWSKALTENEWREHVRNYKSLGVEDSLTNYNYVTNKTGSWERLRLMTMEKQTEQTASINGKINFLDFSENEFHMTATNFPTGSKVFIGDIVGYSYISPYFDEYSTSEKVRVRGYQDEKFLVDDPWATLGPAYELNHSETPLDDPRLSIEFSLVDALNRDIINMFSNLDTLSNAIGSPTLLFSPDYPDLEKLRNVYFNRLSQKLEFQNFFEFYRWFDLSISTFIDQLVPRKTRFKGTNFVIESHMLERHKMEYNYNEIYLGDSTRDRIRDTLLVQQIVGKIGKY